MATNSKGVMGGWTISRTTSLPNEILEHWLDSLHDLGDVTRHALQDCFLAEQEHRPPSAV